MMPRPVVIRRCSACAQLIRQPTISSGNTFGARSWTDGRRHFPMLPTQPWLVRCPHCSALVWLDEQEAVGEADPWDTEDEIFKDALHYETPSLLDHLAKLEEGISDAGKVRYIRIRAWWAGNDPRREGQADTPLSAEETANLRALAALLDESLEDERLMKAEAMRDLGEYEEAHRLLAGPVSDAMTEAAATVESLIAKRIPPVREIDPRTPIPRSSRVRTGDGEFGELPDFLKGRSDRRPLRRGRVWTGDGDPDELPDFLKRRDAR